MLFSVLFLCALSWFRSSFRSSLRCTLPPDTRSQFLAVSLISQCRRDGSWYLEPQWSSSCYAAFHSGADPSEPPITASTSTSTPVVLGGDVTLSVIELIISNSSSSIGGPNASQVARIQIEVSAEPGEVLLVLLRCAALRCVDGARCRSLHFIFFIIFSLLLSLLLGCVDDSRRRNRGPCRCQRAASCRWKHAGTSATDLQNPMNR